MSPAVAEDEARPKFRRPVLQLQQGFDRSANDGVGSLPELIQFNDANNPTHLFAVQQMRKDGKNIGLKRITFRSLRQAVEKCAEWLKSRVPGISAEDDLHPSPEGCRPVALLLESDMTLFIYLCALLWTEIPVLLLSARLGPSAISHLISETGASTVLVSNRTEENATRATSDLPGNDKVLRLVMVESYVNFLAAGQNVQGYKEKGNKRRTNDSPGAIILHSSGTTGLPKPIRLAGRYPIGYAACHRLSPEEAEGRLNLSTLPLYHGFGLLAPCLSLSIGKPCCFPASSIIPSASSTTDLIVEAGARSLMTVPTILEELVSYPDESCFDRLAKLDFIAVGGGAIKPMVGDYLVRKGANLLNHYGATEIGAIAPIFLPDSKYDWHYLRLRNDMGLELKMVDPDDRGCDTWKLVGHPFGWDKPFEVQDLLHRNPNAPEGEMEVSILGRNDDVIVLSTGEKVLPQLFEHALSAHESIETAVVFGDHREEIGILLEPRFPIPTDEQQDFIDSIWPLISGLNKQVDRHARIPSPRAVIVKPNEKSIVRSDKGSVMRKEVIRTFHYEIEAAYHKLKTESASDKANYLDPDDILSSLKSLILSCVNDRSLAKHISDDDDFFESGMDSLETTRLARQLNAIANKSSFSGLSDVDVRPDFVYRNPTILQLRNAIIGSIDGNKIGNQEARGVAMTAMVSRGLAGLLSHHGKAQSADIVILLTGSTGNLGANLLSQFCLTGRIKKIICLNRRPLQRANGGQHSGEHADAVSRQQEELEKKGLNLSSESWEKVEMFHADMQAEFFGLGSKETYTKLVREVTHIVHNAWPMNFKRHLSSFESQIRSLRNLINFCLEIHSYRPGVRPQLLFTSSIAVAGCSPVNTLREGVIDDPLWTASMGYAEAKWACEKLLDETAKCYSSSIEPVIVRVGQLSGSTESGYWNHTEHFPTLVSAGAEVGALPDLNGTYSWLPVDVAAKTITEIMLSTCRPFMVYHVENPIRQSWTDLIYVLSKKLDLSAPIPLDDWISHVASRTDKIVNLEEFFIHEFKKLSSGDLVMSTENSRELSRTLRTCGGIGDRLLDQYIRSWGDQGIL